MEWPESEVNQYPLLSTAEMAQGLNIAFESLSGFNACYRNGADACRSIEQIVFPESLSKQILVPRIISAVAH